MNVKIKKPNRAATLLGLNVCVVKTLYKNIKSNDENNNFNRK